MSNDGIVNIHGKSYMTVAKRVELAHEDAKLQGVKTEVLQHSPVVVVKATVNISGIEYQGISSANPTKAIEKANPYEVAETSAVGRALGFAGYGIIEGIASAEEMVKAGGAMTNENHQELDDEPPFPDDEETKVCSAHDEPAVMLKGYSKSKRDENNNPKAYWYHKENGNICFGSGYKN